MLPRLILIAIAVGTGWWLWRSRRALFGAVVRALYRPPPPPPPPPPLEAGELEELNALAAATDNGSLAEALDLRSKIGELAGARERDLEVAGRIDGVLRQLGRQVRTRARVEETLGEFDEGRMELDMMEARGRLRGAVDEQGRTLATQSMERLQSQQSLLDRLHVRLSELDQASRDTALELRNVHLALLDAASSREGLRGAKLAEVRQALGRAGDDVSLRTEAEEEVERLLRGGDETDT